MFKDIYGYNGKYKVNQKGDVLSVARYVNGRLLKAKLLKPTKNHHGYLFVHLYKNGKRKTWSIHKLVAIHFIGLPNHWDDEVDHNDRNRQNNWWWNLEWVTKLENLKRRRYE